MRNFSFMRAAMLAALLLPAAAFGEKHELGLTLGHVLSQDRGGNGPNRIELDSGLALQANYGYRFYQNDAVAVFAEVHFLANAQRKIMSANPLATRDIATLYVTPGIRVKFAPESPVAPYFAVGGGYGLYEQSYFRVDDEDNQAPRLLHRGVIDFGGGVDIDFWRFIGLRAEVRDFYGGGPAYNIPIGGGQHNIVAGGGFVIKWGD